MTDKQATFLELPRTRRIAWRWVLALGMTATLGCNGGEDDDRVADSPVEMKRIVGTWKRLAKGSSGLSEEYWQFDTSPGGQTVKVGGALKKEGNIEGYTWKTFKVKETFNDGKIVIFEDTEGGFGGERPAVQFRFTSDGVAERRENAELSKLAPPTSWFRLTDAQEEEAVREALLQKLR